MLARAHRLTASADFRRTVRSGVRSGGPVLVVHVLAPGPAADGPPRVGFVVSKAVGIAVVRNRVRRRLRHLVHDRLHRLPAGSTLVVRAQSAAATATYAELGAALDRCLQRTLSLSPPLVMTPTSPRPSPPRSPE